MPKIEPTPTPFMHTFIHTLMHMHMHNLAPFQGCRPHLEGNLNVGGAVLIQRATQTLICCFCAKQSHYSLIPANANRLIEMALLLSVASTLFDTNITPKRIRAFRSVAVRLMSDVLMRSRAGPDVRRPATMPYLMMEGEVMGCVRFSSGTCS